MLFRSYKSQAELAKKGATLSAFNKATISQNFPGAASGEEMTDENKAERALMEGYGHELEAFQVEYPSQFANTLQTIVDNDSNDAQALSDKKLASASLKGIFGANYDEKTNKFKGSDGREYATAKDFLKNAGYWSQKSFYQNAVNESKAHKGISLYDDFETQTGESLRNGYNTQSKLIQATGKIFRKNNRSEEHTSELQSH